MRARNERVRGKRRLRRDWDRFPKHEWRRRWHGCRLRVATRRQTRQARCSNGAGGDGGQKFQGQSLANLLGNVFLHAQNFMEAMIVAGGPDVGLIAALNQLHGNADAFFLFVQADAAFEDVLDVELLGDFAEGFRGVAVKHGRGAGDDAEAPGIQLTKLGEKFLEKTINEISLLGVAAQIVERENGEHGFGVGLAGLVKFFDRSDEAIAQARKSFDVARSSRRVAERAAQFVDRGVQALLKADVAVWPEFLAKDFAGDYAARIFKQRDQNFERLALERNAHAMLAQFPGSDIDLKGSETHYGSRQKLLAHRRETPFARLRRRAGGLRKRAYR